MANDSERLVVLLEARIRDFEKNMAKASGTADRNFTKMRRDSRSATRAMEADIVRSSSRINAALAATSTRIGAFKTAAIAGLGTLGIGLGLGQIASSVRSVVAEAAGLVDTADKIGVTTTALQELRFAGKQAGVEIGTLDNALAFFSKTIGDASRGGGELHDILEANGIAIRDQAGNVRPLNDLFLDYADLVARAGSAQERNLLVTKAFGRSADEMGNMFQDGAKGVRAATDEVNRLGGVIEDGKLRRIAEIDDQWDAFATTLDTKVKSAVLDAVTYLTDLDAHIRAVENRQVMNGLRDQLHGLTDELADVQTALADAQEFRVGLTDTQAKEVDAEIKRLEVKADALIARINAVNQQMLDLQAPTVVPTAPGAPPPGPAANLPSSSTNSTADRADRDREAVVELIAELQREYNLIHATDAERAVSNALRQAGAAATAEQREEITSLVMATISETDAVARLQEQMEATKGMAKDFASSLISDLRAGKTATEALSNAFGNLADRLIEMALDNAINMLFESLLGGGGGGGSGGLGSIINSAISGLFGGGRAGGGDVQAGKAYVVGEKRPELFVPGRSGTIVPSVGGGPTNLNVSVRVLDRTGEGVSVKEGEKRRTPGGGVELDLIVDRMVAAKMGTRGSASNKALRTMGVSGQLTRR